MNLRVSRFSVVSALAVSGLLALASGAAAQCGYVPWVQVSMREQADLRARQARDWNEHLAAEAALEAGRAQVAAAEANAYFRWIANGSVGPCPVQFDPGLPNPYVTTQFRREHPEAFRPSPPCGTMCIPSAGDAADVMDLVRRFQSGSMY